MSSRNKVTGGQAEPPDVAVLRAALSEGDPYTVRALIESGADIRYKCEHGYDALLDAVHGRDVSRDGRLVELLELLIAHGVDLSGVTTYEESGLRVLSRLGRFDAIQTLLNAGADKNQLEWTPLIEAVALGSLASVEAVLARGAALEDRDWWSRTAWLLSLLVGDIAKAKLLRDHGADVNARGRCGDSPLFYPIEGHHPDVLRWLLSEGADVHQVDEFGTTALIEAVEHDDLECVDILLNAGAEVDADSNGTALSRAGSRVIAMRLLEAGADPANLSYEGHRTLIGLPEIDPEVVSTVPLDHLREGASRRFGGANPERMQVPIWETMIRCGASAYYGRQRLEREFGQVTQPVWSAQRLGQSLTLLPDGRALQVGGEHEDFYDPDFCIYNDVFVHERDGAVAIYGYPESVFPPTDFHTATLIGDWIYLIGSLGYDRTRPDGQTPVYRLNIHTFQIERLDAQGEAPGSIHKHRAAAMSSHEIRVWGGRIQLNKGGEESLKQNVHTFMLDLNRLRWHREK